MNIEHEQNGIPNLNESQSSFDDAETMEGNRNNSIDEETNLESTEGEPGEIYKCSECWGYNEGNFCGNCGHKFDKENEKYTFSPEELFSQGFNMHTQDGKDLLTPENVEKFNITIGGVHVTKEILEKKGQISEDPAEWRPQLRFLERTRLFKKVFKNEDVSVDVSNMIEELKSRLPEVEAEEALKEARIDVERHAFMAAENVRHIQ